jgi:hypothetical protein
MSITARTGTIMRDHAPTRHPRIDRRATECEKLSASEAPDPGRHHVGIPGDIISECPGDFVGIRSGDYPAFRIGNLGRSFTDGEG